MSMNENVQLGYAMDPVGVYGPSAGSYQLSDREEADHGVITGAPLEGAVGPGTAGAPGNRPDVREFIRRPAGQLVILLPLAYLAFHRVFGSR